MPHEEWDRYFYVDEAIRSISAPNGKKITLMGAGLGVRYDKTKLRDWCAIAYHNEKNGENGYWNVLGDKCLELILDECSKSKPDKIYVCSPTAFFVMRSLVTANLPRRQSEFLTKAIKPICKDRYMNHNHLYKSLMKAIGSAGLSPTQSRIISKVIRSVYYKPYRRHGELYKTKQEVGRMARDKLDEAGEKLKTNISQEDMAKILEGRLYDIRHNIFI